MFACQRSARNGSCQLRRYLRARQPLPSSWQSCCQLCFDFKAGTYHWTWRSRHCSIVWRLVLAVFSICLMRLRLEVKQFWRIQFHFLVKRFWRLVAVKKHWYPPRCSLDGSLSSFRASVLGFDVCWSCEWLEWDFLASASPLAPCASATTEIEPLKRLISRMT